MHERKGGATKVFALPVNILAFLIKFLNILDFFHLIQLNFFKFAIWPICNVWKIRETPTRLGQVTEVESSISQRKIEKKLP